MAVKVKLRTKSINSGKAESLYLDYYPAIPHPKTGKPTRREFLGMYLYADKKEITRKAKELASIGKDAPQLKKLAANLKPLTPIEKKANEETRNLAEQIRQKRENEYNKPEIYSDYEREKLELREKMNHSFLSYFEKLADKKSPNNRGNWLSALRFLTDYSDGALLMANLNEPFLEGFKEYLLKSPGIKSPKNKLARNTAASYFNKVKAALRQAYKDGYLQFDINTKIASIKPEATRREYLTLEELNRLVKTPCKDEVLKRAALFSALTGLRFSDIHKLTWSEVEHIKEYGYFLNFRQKKTHGMEKQPISEQAFNLMDSPGDPEEKAFKGLEYSAVKNKILSDWITDAGITKKISFHCFRHTFATLQLWNGTDIYTVSKLLGHQNLSTTQVYAKIVDEAKQAAANRIKLDL